MTHKLCTIVGSDKGGVGKSMISMIMALVFERASEPLMVIEIDNQQKLSSNLGANRVDLSIAAAPELGKISRNRHAAESFYNQVYQTWDRGQSVTDLGANVTTSLLDWYRQCGIAELAAEDGIRFRFVACASPDDQAIRSALSGYQDARKTFGNSAEYFVVLNDTTGLDGFKPYERNAAYAELRRLAAARELRVLEVPFCDSSLLEHARPLGFNPVQAVEQYEEIAASAGLDSVATRVHRRKMISWMKDVQVALEPLLTVPRASEATSGYGLALKAA